MEFRTTITDKNKILDINYRNTMAFIGSCFSTHIGKKMMDLQFNVSLNPFGILFNPISISNAISRIACGLPFNENEFTSNGEQYISFDHHGRFSRVALKEIQDAVNEEFNDAVATYHKVDYLMISLGTAWVYELIESGKVVANCHKMNSNKFSKKLLAANEIEEALKLSIAELRKVNMNVKVIFTLSPVRHIKDGLENDRLSKSVLRVAIENLTNEIDNCYYFPAYELLIDDLRDYRFYDKDMIHPSESAIEYIWDHFRTRCIDPEALIIMKEIDQLNKEASHRSIYPDSKEDQKRKNELVRKIDQLEKVYELNLNGIKKRMLAEN